MKMHSTLVDKEVIRKPVRAQLARFVRTEADKVTGKWEFGIALVKEIGTHDVIAMLDADGKKVRSIWTYDLVNHPIGTAIDSARL